MRHLMFYLAMNELAFSNMSCPMDGIELELHQNTTWKIRILFQKGLDEFIKIYKIVPSIVHPTWN